MLNEMFTMEVPHGTGYRAVEIVVGSYAWIDPLVEAMIKQDPAQRPQSIDAVKRELICQRQSCVIRQRVAELDSNVVSTTAVVDPLVANPPQLVDFEWANGTLTLELSQAENAKWISALQNMGVMRQCGIRSRRRFALPAIVQRSPSDDQVQRTIDYFKDWIPRATWK